ncbi:MAG TPA: hypothetical protein VG871_18755, partial [Vicinamibacterales bacterium]|nr:hypothetical protein [Vicinamibacterales bacterium]
CPQGHTSSDGGARQMRGGGPSGDVTKLAKLAMGRAGESVLDAGAVSGCASASTAMGPRNETSVASPGSAALRHEQPDLRGWE